MLRGLWKLTWIEIKVFMREPLGAFGTVGFPVLVFLVIGRVAGGNLPARSLATSGFLRVGLPVLAALLIAVSSVISLVTIVSIYREGGILKRLRATPLRPQTILTAHVMVKLALTALTMALTVLAGKRYYPVPTHFPIFGFTMALPPAFKTAPFSKRPSAATSGGRSLSLKRHPTLMTHIRPSLAIWRMAESHRSLPGFKVGATWICSPCVYSTVRASGIKFSQQINPPMTA